MKNRIKENFEENKNYVQIYSIFVFRLIFFTIFFLSLIITEFQTEPKENDFLIFDFTMENIKSNQI